MCVGMYMCVNVCMHVCMNVCVAVMGWWWAPGPVHACACYRKASDISLCSVTEDGISLVVSKLQQCP